MTMAQTTWPSTATSDSVFTIHVTSTATTYYVVHPTQKELAKLLDVPHHVTSSAEGYRRLVREGRRGPSRPPVRGRHGYQQMARLPCYRGKRTR